MNEHDRVRTLLPLAASGDISPEELRRVQEHLESCEACRSAGEEFASIARVLRGIPTPEPSADLVARVEDMARSRLVQESGIRNDTAVLAPLVVASWVAALATWPLLKGVAGWVFTGWHVPSGTFGTALAAYSILGFLLACVSAFAVGVHARKVRRTR